jgi:hypothetical protein
MDAGVMRVRLVFGVLKTVPAAGREVRRQPIAEHFVAREFSSGSK